MDRNFSKKPNGCLWLIITIIFGVIGFAVFTFLFSLPPLLAIIAALAIAIFFSVVILGRPTTKSLILNGLLITFLFFGIKYGTNQLLSILKQYDYSEDSFSSEEIVSETKILEGIDSIPVYTSNRFWKDNYGQSYTTSLTVRQRDVLQLRGHITRYTPPNSDNFWGQLYDYIDKTDTPSLDLVLDAFNKINMEKRLNQMEFAEMVISCIQDIPYAFVFQDSCLQAENYEKSIKDILQSCPECCIGNITYGIQNPVSFIQNLKGDCDTRTVLIYSILKYFDYDVAILNSDYYRHSILGVNLPASGKFKMYRGKKYTLWETTAKHFTAGSLPANFDDVQYWDVVLTSK